MDATTLPTDRTSGPHLTDCDLPILVTGSSGFIGSHLVKELQSRGFRRIRCLTRTAEGAAKLARLSAHNATTELEIVHGNLLSRQVCQRAADGVAVVYHLAAGVEKSFAGCFLNSVVATRNLLEAVVAAGTVRRFVNVSSLAVYSNADVRRGDLIDEACAIDHRLVERYDPYAFGKAKQDDIVREYGRIRGVRYVIVRPGVTFGPGKAKIPGRVGIDTFGVFLHVGMGNRLPLTYVDNCAEAIALAGLRPCIDGEEMNIVDDDLPRSRQFLRGYKTHVRSLLTIPVPYPMFYALNYAWEKYSKWSSGQLPPVFNRLSCEAYYKSHTFSNKRAKEILQWQPKVSMDDALSRYYAAARSRKVAAGD